VITTRRLLTVVSSLVLAVAGTFVAASPAAASHYVGGHWAHDGHSHPQIYFVDHTGAGWPVDASTYKWNETQGVDSWYRWANCPNLAGIHCVHVNEIWGDTSTYGTTYFGAIGTGGHFINGNVRIELNSNAATNPTQRRKSACHELGHALGLDHRFETSSCMMQGDAVARGISMYPDGHDFGFLHDIYNHPS
jgi:hypothetical protein